MADSYTERSSTSWFSRIKESIKGIFIGFFLVALGIFILVWNEGRAVKTEKGLKEGAGVVVSVASDSVLPANEGKLVHLSGALKTSGPVIDEAFAFQVPGALRLIRVVEMYQWRQSTHTDRKKKLGGGEETVTTYTYEKGWHEGVIDSKDFKKPEGHQNPTSLPYPPAQFQAAEVRINAFLLSDALKSQLNDSQNIPLREADLQALPEAIRSQVKLRDGRLYLSANPDNPQLGDSRIGFSAVPASDATVVAQQRGDSFQPFVTAQGTQIQLLSRGVKTAPEMFADAQASNRTMTWILRGVGLFFLFVALRLILGPVAVLADVVPWAGSLVGAGVGLVSFLFALAIGLAAIAFSWLYYRPVLAAFLFMGVGGLLTASFLVLRKNRPAPVPAAG